MAQTSRLAAAGLFQAPFEKIAQFVPPTNDYAGILSAYNQAVAAGGGTVKLPEGEILLSQTLPVSSGIIYEGVLPVLGYSLGTSGAIPDGSSTNLVGGTILKAGGAFPAFSYNANVLAAPSTSKDFTLQGATNCGFKNLGFDGFTYGILAGNTNAASFWYSIFDNLYFINCTEWALSITNFQHCLFHRIYSYGGANGQYYGNDVPQSILQPGNSVWNDIYHVVPSTTDNLKLRGLVYRSLQGGMNQGFLSRIQCNRFNTTRVTQAATMTNGVSTFTVTDGTKFAVDMPVSFSATVNGFTTRQIYFVRTLAGNTISVADTHGGTAITATGATAVNITTAGFPCLEVVGKGAGNTITAHDFYNVDCEGGGETAFYLQNGNGSSFQFSQMPTASQSTQQVCLRSSQNNNIFCYCGGSTDYDGNSSASTYNGLRFAGSVQFLGIGVSIDQASLNRVFSFGTSSRPSALGDFAIIGGQNFIYPNVGFGKRVQTFGGSSVTLNGSHTGCVTLNGTGNFTYTLPVITSANVGATFNISNSYASTVITVNTSSSQLFNDKAALTSITLQSNASMTITAVNGGGKFYWAIEGFGGTYSAGNVTGI